MNAYHWWGAHGHNTADFLGGLRPVRGKEQMRAQLVTKLRDFFEGSLKHREALNDDLVQHTERALNHEIGDLSEMVVLAERMGNVLTNHYSDGRITTLLAELEEISGLHKTLRALFAWYDGPLVQAMKHGDLFLVDEISLAEDSVLERLNRLPRLPPSPLFSTHRSAFPH